MARRPPESPRRRLSRAERRAQIIDTAIGLFAERGLAATTSASLAGACGVSEALVFRIFGSKRGLYEAIIERVVARGEGLFPADAAEARDDVEVFRRLGEAIIARSEADPSFLKLLLHSALEEPEFMHLLRDAQGLKVTDRLAAYLATRVEEGAFRPIDPGLTALGFVGLVHQLVLARVIYRLPTAPRATAAEAAREYAELFVRGVRRDAVAGPGAP